MTRIITLSFLWLASIQAFSQKINVKTLDEVLGGIKGDSTMAMSLDAYVTIILANHPVVKQADLLSENARQKLRLARGAFDPKLEASWDVKNFKNTEYYDIVNTTLKVPTWFPVDPKISVDRNRGVFLNPENSIPGSDNFRQITAGVSLPVGRGLLIDERRAAVKQAQIFGKMADVERIKAINKILLSATRVYWDWYFAHYNYLLVQESLNISQEIFSRVKVDFEFGEAAAIDTVQAAITLQNRLIDQQDALIKLTKSGLKVSNYLWNEYEQPLEVGDLVYPTLDTSNIKSDMRLDSLKVLALNQHPELRKTNLKINELDVDKRLAKENLKPRIDLNYNLINAPLGSDGDFSGIQLGSDYKFGVAFEFPLFLRKERAKLKQTEIKIEQTSFLLKQQELEVVNDVQASYIELVNTQSMLALIQQAVDNYELLLNAELFNLENGESDLFKINFQQDKLLAAQVKLVKAKATLEKVKVNLYWSVGIPYLNFEAPE